MFDYRGYVTGNPKMNRSQNVNKVTFLFDVV